MFVLFTDFNIYESHLLSQILLANYLFPLRLMLLSQRATYQLPAGEAGVHTTGRTRAGKVTNKIPAARVIPPETVLGQNHSTGLG